MKNTRTPNISATVNSRAITYQRAPLERFTAFFQLIVLLGLTITFLMISIAYARAAQRPEVAALPTAPLSLAAVCDAGVVVFSVQNNAPRWRDRGAISIVEVVTGRVVRERRLTLGERQMASFRVASADIQGQHTRVTVRMPDESMTYVKSFTGRCVAQR